MGMIEPQSVYDAVNGTLLGHYRATLMTGLTTGMAANAPIASLRWTDAGVPLVATDPLKVYQKPKGLILLGIDVGAVVTTAFTTPQSVDIEAIIARAFTAADSAGSNVTPSRNRATFAPSLITGANLQVGTTGALTAGTRTLDGSGFVCATIYTQNAPGCGETYPNIYGMSRDGQFPITLTTNEGIIFRVPTAQGAVGVVKYYITVEWAEVSLEGPTGFHPA